MPVGLSVAFLSGILPVLALDEPFMTSLWMHHAIPVIGKLNTALFFDIGVYIVVQGVTLTIIFTISESA